MHNLGNITRQRGGIRPGCLISIIVVVVLVIGVSVGGYFWFTGMIGDQATLAVKDDPTLEEHIGEIQEIDVNWGATGAAEENQDKDRDPNYTYFVFDVVGSKGSGRLKVAMTQGGEKGMIFSDGSLKMADGKTHVLETTKRAPKETPPAAGDAETAPASEKAPAPKKDD